jgi:hypothetical protein
MTTDTETLAPTTEVTANEPTQYEFPEGWTFPSYDPRGHEENGTQVVYVNTVRAGNRDSWVGTFRHAEAGRANDGWTSGGRRVYGAVVNPAPYNNRHYLVFGRFVVRYNDEYNTNLRNHSAHPYSIICAADGTPWYFPNDSLPSLEGSDYITLSQDTVSNLGQRAEAEEPAAPALWEDGREAITFGYARQEEDGTVLLNPDPTPGDVYIVWDSRLEAEAERHMAYVCVYEGGGPVEQAFAPSGHWYRYYDQSDWNTSAVFNSIPDRWVKLGFRSDYTEPVNTYTADFERATLKSHKELETFNTETNKLALRHSWCGTYESIIQPLGMKSRWHGWWTVEVQAKTCITRDSITGYTARDILAGLGISGREITNLSLEATFTFYVNAVQADSEDEAKELVTPEMMTAALARQSPDTNFADMTDVEIVSVTEDRDAAVKAAQQRNDDE